MKCLLIWTEDRMRRGCVGFGVDWHRSWIQHAKGVHTLSNIATSERTNNPIRKKDIKKWLWCKIRFGAGNWVWEFLERVKYSEAEFSGQVNLEEFYLPRHNAVYVGFDIFTDLVMKRTIFWDVTPCSPLSVNRRFGGTYRFHLQGRKNKFGKKPACTQRQAEWSIPPKRRLTFNGLYGVIFPKDGSLHNAL
jgi:hypothetical protein